MFVSEARRWRVQAFWRYGSESRSYSPSFVENERDAVRIRDELRLRLDHPHFQDLEVRVEQLDAAIADAEEAELRRRERERASPVWLEQRLSGYGNFLRSPAAEEALAEGRAVMETARRRRQQERPSDARALLSDPDFVSVERFDDGAREFAITFDDLAASTFEDLVEQTVEIAPTYPGVTDAWHEDRELIVLSGAPDPSGLERAVREWWFQRLQEELHS